jgi:hypothetical protein
LQNQAWQIEEIKRSLEQAEAGDFAGDEEVEAFFCQVASLDSYQVALKTGQPPFEKSPCPP